MKNNSVRLSLDFDLKTHRKLKVLAAALDTSMNALVHEGVDLLFDGLVANEGRCGMMKAVEVELQKSDELSN